MSPSFEQMRQSLAIFTPSTFCFFKNEVLASKRVLLVLVILHRHLRPQLIHHGQSTCMQETLQVNLWGHGLWGCMGFVYKISGIYPASISMWCSKVLKIQILRKTYFPIMIFVKCRTCWRSWRPSSSIFVLTAACNCCFCSSFPNPCVLFPVPVAQNRCSKRRDSTDCVALKTQMLFQEAYYFIYLFI